MFELLILTLFWQFTMQASFTHHLSAIFVRLYLSVLAYLIIFVQVPQQIFVHVTTKLVQLLNLFSCRK